MVRQIRAGHICVKVGGNCLKYLKWGWNRTEWRGHKFSEKEGQAGSRGGKGWNPLTSYAYSKDLSWPHFNDYPRVQEKQ